MIDQFKTQVMFLHPEPSLMEPCARLLGEDFSVHMAASGTEALTTLGITPIDVIVSAQDLPGMSGQEALKEAKRRSPETIGILLSSENMTDDDRAALVNVRHLNKILRPSADIHDILAAIHQTLNPAAEPIPTQSANDSGALHNANAPAAQSAIPQADLSATRSNIPMLEPGAGNDTSRTSPASLSDVEILVLTNDASFLKTIRAATGSSHVVNHAPNLQQALDIVREGRCGVLLTDAAVAVRDVKTITTQLRRHMPSLVTIVAGRREEGEKMMGLISDGLVYRFLLKPISPGRSRLAIEASAKKHLTLAQTDVPLSADDVDKKMTETGIIRGVTFDSDLFKTTDLRKTTHIAMPSLDDDEEPGLFERLGGLSPLVFAAAGVAVAAVVFMMSRSSEPETTDTSRSAEAQVAVQQPSIEESLRLGDRAVAQDRLISPADDNAVLHYARALANAPDNNVAKVRLESILEQVFDGVETDLLNDNLANAGDTLQVLNSRVPNHPRLAFLNRELSKETARRELTEIDVLLTNGDITGAELRIDRLRQSGTVDAGVLNALDNRLNSARESRNVQTSLTNNAGTATTSAATRTTRPASDPAVADIAPTQTTDEPVASQPSTSGPERVEPTQSATTSDAAAPTQSSAELQLLLNTANARVAAGNLITPTDDSAADYYRAALATDPDNAIATQGLQFIGSLLLAQTRTAIATGDTDVALTQLAAAAELGANESDISNLRGQIDAAIAAAEQQQALSEPPANVVASEPEPVEPEYELIALETPGARYPSTALRRNLEGWVDVEFLVQADGRTSDVVAVASEPGSVFDKAAVNAVESWRYQPLSETDPSASKRARVRLEFNLTE
ncbi:MAG: TonB family protein [Pseudomonadota bacterium]